MKSLTVHARIADYEDAAAFIESWLQHIRLSKQIISENGIVFPEKLRVLDDMCFNYICFGKASKISYLPTPLYHYCIEEGSITNSYKSDRVDLDKQVFEYIKKVREEGRIRADYGCEGFLGNYEGEVRNRLFSCQAGISVGSVMADGSIAACTSIRSDYNQGNIYEDDFMEVWENRYMLYRDRSWMKRDECADCKYFRYCQGNGMHLRDSNGKLLFCHLKRLG